MHFKSKLSLQESPDYMIPSCWDLEFPAYNDGHLDDRLRQLCCELTDACASSEQRLEAALELKQLSDRPAAADFFLANLGLLESLLIAAADASDASASHLESSLFSAMAGLMSARGEVIGAFLDWTIAVSSSGRPSARMAVKFATAWLLKSPGLARRCPPGSQGALLTAALILLKSAPSVRFGMQLLAMTEAAVTAPLPSRWAVVDEAATGAESQVDELAADLDADSDDDPLTGILAFLADQLRLPRTQHCLRLRAVELAVLSAGRGASRRQLASGVWPVLREGLRPRRGQLDADLAELAVAGLADCASQLRLAGVDEVAPALVEFVTCGGGAIAEGLASAQLTAMATADQLIKSESPDCASVWVINSCAQLLRWCLSRRLLLGKCLDRLFLAQSLLDGLLRLIETPVPVDFAVDARALLRLLAGDDGETADEERVASDNLTSPVCSLLSLTGRLYLLPSLAATHAPVELVDEVDLLVNCLSCLLAWAPGHCEGRRLLPRLRLLLRQLVDVADGVDDAFTGCQVAQIWLAYSECQQRAGCLGWLDDNFSADLDEASLAADCWQLMQRLPKPADFSFGLQPFATLAEALTSDNRRLADAALSIAARAGAVSVFFAGCCPPPPSSVFLPAGLLLESVCTRHPDRRRPLRCLQLLLDDLDAADNLLTGSDNDCEGVIEVISCDIGEVSQEFCFDVDFDATVDAANPPPALHPSGVSVESSLSELAFHSVLTGLGYWLCLADRLRRDPAELLEPPLADSLSLRRLTSTATRLAARVGAFSVGQVAEAADRFAQACLAHPESLGFALRGLCRLSPGAGDANNFILALLRRLVADSTIEDAFDVVVDIELCSPDRGRQPPPGLARASWLAFAAQPDSPAAVGRLSRLLADPVGHGPDRRLFSQLADFLQLRPDALPAVGRLLCDLLACLPPDIGGCAAESVADLAFLCTAFLPAEPFPALLNRCLAWLKLAMPARRFDCLRLSLLLEPRVAGLLQRSRGEGGSDDSQELRCLLAELLQVSVATWKAAELREPTALRKLETAVLLCASRGLLPTAET